VPAIEGQKRQGRTGLICGTGPFAALAQSGESVRCDTQWGTVELARVRFGESEVFVVLRHGAGQAVPAQRVNYRAIVAALAMQGVENVIALNAVGGIASHANPGSALIPDQFLDFTRARPSTFYDAEGDPIVHVDLTAPYCLRHRRLLRESCASVGMPFTSTGTYVCAEGPRYESSAEVTMFARLGGDVVGMTGVPEVVLAREAGLCYASLCVVSNNAAGVGTQERLRHGDVTEAIGKAYEQIKAVLDDALPRVQDDPACECRSFTA